MNSYINQQTILKDDPLHVRNLLNLVYSVVSHMHVKLHPIVIVIHHYKIVLFPAGSEATNERCTKLQAQVI